MDGSLALAARAVLRTLEISAPTLLDGIVGRGSPERVDARIASWSRKLLDEARATLEVRGRENVPATPSVVMSNHQSHYDVPILFQAVPARMRMIAKRELFRVPVFGPALAAAGFIAIDRGNREKAIESLEQARASLATGTHIWIAPEGTRSRDGALGPFKKGGFILAKESGLPILPVTVVGSRDILPSHSYRVRRGAHVVVTIHPAIDPAEFPDRDALMARVREAIASAL